MTNNAADNNTKDSSNWVLIGMPGSGKSTVGKALAQQLSRPFIDTDLLIEQQTGYSLQTTVDTKGYQYLREREEQILLGLNINNDTNNASIISTGGSAVYSQAGMTHLQTNGLIVYLAISCETMLQRIGNAGSRGLAKQTEQSLETMYNERLPLYRHYADMTIDCNLIDPSEIQRQILDGVEKQQLGGD